MRWYCRLIMKNSDLDSLVSSWGSLIWEPASPMTHKPKIVNESLLDTADLSAHGPIIALQVCLGQWPSFKGMEHGHGSCKSGSGM